MYSTRTGLILAFHGCDASVVKKVLNGEEKLSFSKNDYDWLGFGNYFWDNSPSRALQFAKMLQKYPNTNNNTKITKPAVIGAILNLGYCLDLLDYSNLTLLKLGYDILIQKNTESGEPIPINHGGITKNKDLLFRNLDCAVIETLHQVRREQKLREFDSVRGVFWEGSELYLNAGFKSKNHIQICIRNPNCIKGFFLPQDLNKNYSNV